MKAGLYEQALDALFGRWYVEAAASALSFDRKQIQRQVQGTRSVTDATLDKVIALMVLKREQDNRTLMDLRREREARAESASRGREGKRGPKGPGEGQRGREQGMIDG